MMFVAATGGFRNHHPKDTCCPVAESYLPKTVNQKNQSIAIRHPPWEHSLLCSLELSLRSHIGNRLGYHMSPRNEAGW